MSVVKYDTRGLRNLVKGIRSLEGKVEKAAAKSINRTLTTVRKEVTMGIREDWNLTSKSLKKDMGIEKATQGHLEGRLSSSGGPGIPLIEYRGKKGIRPWRVPSTRWKGTAPHKRAVPGQIVIAMQMKRQLVALRHSFIAQMHSGHVGLFNRVPGRRMGGSNKPAIRELYGPSATKILASGRYSKEIGKRAQMLMAKNMRHETRYMLSRLGK